MGFFDNFNLPTAVGNALSSVNTRVAEAASFVKTGFNGAGPFKKLGAQADDLKNAAAKFAFRKAEILQQNGDALVASLAETSRLVAEDAWTFNQLTSDEATKLVQDSIDADVSARFINDATETSTGTKVDTGDYKVRLVGIGRGGGSTSLPVDKPMEIVFDVMPEVTESRSVEYEAVAPSQFIGAFQKFKGTAAVEWQVNAVLISRTSAEAYRNLTYINQLRAWSMPFFGENTRMKFPTRLGAPPSVLKFSGWRRGMVGPVPVVITSLNWTFQQDVDYIPAIPDDSQSSVAGVEMGPNGPTPFPTVVRVQMQLRESFSTTEFNAFDLDIFAGGDMVAAYGQNTVSSSRTALGEAVPGSGQAPVVQEQGFISPSAFGTGPTPAFDTGTSGFALPSPPSLESSLPNLATASSVQFGGQTIGSPVTQVTTAPQTATNSEESTEVGRIESGIVDPTTPPSF